MPLKINPGPLPNDGSRINVDDVFTAFVNGTNVFDFGLENFTDSGVGFMVSSTDAPATSARTRSLIWFKRGEGILYHWHVFTPTSGPTSGVTNGRFLAGSGSRKDMVVEAAFPVDKGDPVFIDSSASEFHYRIMAHDFMMPRVSGDRWTSHTDVTLTSDAGASILGFWHERHRDPCFVALESAVGYSGHQYIPVCEVGYCLGAVDTDYTGPSKLIFRQGTDDSRFIMDPGETVRTDEPYAAHGLESGVAEIVGGRLAPADEHDQVLIFLRPSMSHRDE